MTLDRYLQRKERDVTDEENYAVRVLIKAGVATEVISEALCIKPLQVAGIRAAMTNGN